MRAEGFYRGVVGLDVTRRRHGASFMSSGRYHHHIAANVWHSAGAKARDPEHAGLSWLEFAAADGASFDALASRLTKAGLAITATPAGIETCDPWGTRLRIARD
jgi:catechol 2,3-dioxygenase